MKWLFVTGTDTEVGKTHVACMILRQLREAGVTVAAYKPVCSGSQRCSQGGVSWNDLERLREATGDRQSIDEICRQRFHAALAPCVAATLEQRQVDCAVVDEGLRTAARGVEALIVEGAGGWLCPFDQSRSMADWAVAWKFPVLIVARSGLGTINHTLLTVESIRSRGLSIAGIVLNSTAPGQDRATVQSNLEEIERRAGIPVLGELPFGSASEPRRSGIPIKTAWLDLMKPPADDGLDHAAPMNVTDA